MSCSVLDSFTFDDIESMKQINESFGKIGPGDVDVQRSRGDSEILRLVESIKEIDKTNIYNDIFEFATQLEPEKVEQSPAEIAAIVRSRTRKTGPGTEPVAGALERRVQFARAQLASRDESLLPPPASPSMSDGPELEPELEPEAVASLRKKFEAPDYSGSGSHRSFNTESMGDPVGNRAQAFIGRHMLGAATRSEFDHSRDFRPEQGKRQQQVAVDAAKARRQLGMRAQQKRERRVPEVPPPQPELEPEPEHKPEPEKPAAHTEEIEQMLENKGWEWFAHDGRYYYHNKVTKKKQWELPYLGPTTTQGYGVVEWDDNRNTYIINYPDGNAPEVVDNYGLNWPALRPNPRLSQGGGNKQSGKNRKRTNRKRTNRKRTNRKRTNRKRTNRKHRRTRR